MALDNWGEALFRMVSAIVPMYVVMLFGVFASRWKVIDKPESKGKSGRHSAHPRHLACDEIHQMI